VDTGLFRTNVGLAYFREAKSGKQFTDEQLLVLYSSILAIENTAIRQMEEIAGTAEKRAEVEENRKSALARDLRDL